MTGADFDHIAAVIALIATIPVFKGWFVGAASWNKRRRLELLRTQERNLIALHDSDREYVGWLLHSLLLVATVFGAALMFRGVEVTSDSGKLIAIVHWALGGAAYFIAVSALGMWSRLKNYDKTLAKLRDEISKLSKSSSPDA